MSGERDDESFLARWSRRKQSEGLRGREPEARSALDARPPSADAAAIEPGQDSEAAVEDDRPLPSLDDLKPDSDLTAFLEKRVPEELRRQALRRMWTMDPTISTFIEMAENQYDWNVPGGAPLFGDLDAGTDVAALLAQATGAVPTPAVPPVETASASEAGRDAVASLSSEAAPVGRGVAGSRPGEPGAAAAGDAERPIGLDEPQSASGHAKIGNDSAPGSNSPGEGEVSAQMSGNAGVVRRHGGALPS